MVSAKINTLLLLDLNDQNTMNGQVVHSRIQSTQGNITLLFIEKSADFSLSFSLIMLNQAQSKCNTSSNYTLFESFNFVGCYKLCKDLIIQEPCLVRCTYSYTCFFLTDNKITPWQISEPLFATNWHSSLLFKSLLKFKEKPFTSPFN